MAVDFFQALRGGIDPGNSFTEGVQAAQAQQDYQRKLQQQQIAQQQAAAARAGIVDALNTGDYNKASAIASAGGLNDAATNYANLAKTGFDQHEKATLVLAHVAAGVATLPYEQRRGAIQSIKTWLASSGIDPNDIDSFDPTDANLAAISGVDYAMKDRVGDQNTAYANETDRIKAEQPMNVGPGSSLVLPSGQEVYHNNQYISVPTTDSLFEVGGNQSQGYATTTGMFDRMIGAESRGQQFAPDGSPLRSTAGAVGIAQVMPATGPEAARLAGLPWDAQRFANDPGYNRALGEAYYNAQVEHYGGDQIKAAAAYNAGPGRVDRAIARAARTGGNWTDYLPAETRDYITKVSGQQNTQRPVRQIQQGVPNASATGANPYGLSKTQIGNARTKLANLDGINAQLDRVEKNMAAAEKHGWTGFIEGRVPGALDAESDTFDKSVRLLASLIRQLTRTPGEGSMSDYESRLAELTLPSRTDTAKGRREAIAGIRELIGNIRSGYAEMLSGAGGGKVRISRADAERLRANPNLASQFDEIYGSGAAAKVLGQ